MISNEAILNQQKHLEEISCFCSEFDVCEEISCICSEFNVCEGHQLKHAGTPKLTTGPSKSVNKNFEQHLKEQRHLDTFQDVKQFVRRLTVISLVSKQYQMKYKYFDNSLFEKDIDAMEILPNA
ncbi:hypothetical protein SNE40_006299 [Patella caerulea]|uniref:Uncharacterized protein n=1 Tax=Patella caerulea TaxID=87958 RepID=A0AAN8QB03_PATCE